MRPGDAESRGTSPVLRNPFLWAFLIGIVSLTLIRPLLRRVPEPPPLLVQLPAYRLVDSGGGSFGSADLAGKVYVANFFFTRCVSICPDLTRSMARLAARYAEARVADVLLVSITVDPEHDTPERLAEYAAAHGVDPRRWALLTGEPERVRELILGGFKMALGRAEQHQDSLVDIAHSGKLVLVDGAGWIRGYYDSDAEGQDETFHRSRHVLAP